MKYKLLAIDLDDTLLNNDLVISNKNKEMIKKAKDIGTKVVICSGRSKPAMKYYIDELKEFGSDEYFISFNGAMLIDLKNNNVIYSQGVEKEIVLELIQYSRIHNINIQLYVDDYLYVENYNDTIREYERLAGIKSTLVEDVTTVINTGSIKVLFNDDHDILKIVKNDLGKMYDEKLNIFFSKPNYLEFLNKDINKGIAVMKLASYLNIKSEEVITIGDSFNDLSMIEIAGLGVAMVNGHPKVKEKANYVTINDNNNDGVAEVIEKFIVNG